MNGEGKARWYLARNERRKAIIAEAKSGGCLDCGRLPDEEDALEFHHRDPSTKLYTIGKTRTGKGANVPYPGTASPTKLLAEIEKCDVLCRECHKKRHSGELSPLIQAIAARYG